MLNSLTDQGLGQFLHSHISVTVFVERIERRHSEVILQPSLLLDGEVRAMHAWACGHVCGWGLYICFEHNFFWDKFRKLTPTTTLTGS